MKRNALWMGLLAGAVAACGGEEAGETADFTVMEDTAATVEPAAGAAGAGAAAARAVLQNAQGDTVGTAEFTQAGQGVQIAVNVSGLPSGEHGIHLHQTGQCTAPDFQSAGGHLNPTQSQHGFENPQGPHMGDLRNLTVGQDGTAQQSLSNERATMDALFDGDGTAVVIHAGPDDYRTDPSGDSGGRIACGVVTQG